MKTKLGTLREKVNSGQFPVQFPHFGGANLIITNEPDRRYHDGDVVICTAHASAMSWLVEELKSIYSEDLDFSNKYDFYPQIGRLIKESLSTDFEVFESMLYVIDQIEKEWGTK